MEPQWQPISMLPVFSDLINTVHDSSFEQLRNLERAADRPHVLDKRTLQRILDQYSEQLDHQSLYENQLNRWKNENLTKDQGQEVDRLLELLPPLKKNTIEILEIAKNLSRQLNAA